MLRIIQKWPLILSGILLLFALSLFTGACGNEGKEVHRLRGEVRKLQQDVAALQKNERELKRHPRDDNYEILRSIGMLHSNLDPRNYKIMDEALGKFDPEIQRYLALIPIIAGDAKTALARTRTYEPPLNIYTVVSHDWDRAYGQSVYWESVYEDRGEDPNKAVFPRSFKLNLIVHEYLHHAELKANVELEAFANDVFDWYLDPAWGPPTTEGNYMKYFLYWSLYGGNGDPNWHSAPGRGEFAFIGENIASGTKARLSELPPNIISYYKGILTEDLLKLDSR